MPAYRAPATPDAFKFGSAFHRLILEPDTVKLNEYDGWSDKDYTMLCNMGDAVLSIPDLVLLLNSSDRETVRQWIDQLTGLPCKGKLDAVVKPRNRHLIDLKTTSCASLTKFTESCLAYDYDRQGAFYLSSDSEATFFEIVGVQKQAPYKVYRITYHKDSEFIQYGRKKMDFWLKRAHEESLRADGWRPSAWSRKELIT